MPLIVNGVTIPTYKPFTCNGQDVRKVIANGTVVWEYIPVEPFIVLNGPNPLVLTVGDKFIDPMAVVHDVVDGNKTIYTVTPVDTSVVGATNTRYIYVNSLTMGTRTDRTVIVNAP